MTEFPNEPVKEIDRMAGDGWKKLAQGLANDRLGIGVGKDFRGEKKDQSCPSDDGKPFCHVWRWRAEFHFMHENGFLPKPPAGNHRPNC
jgi:hypothetical protein